MLQYDINAESAKALLMTKTQGNLIATEKNQVNKNSPLKDRCSNIIEES